MKKKSQLLIIVFCLLAISCSLFAATPQHQRQARQILEATGIQGGLVVHIGCDDGKLTAALGAGGSYLVHGLDANAKNVEIARKYIKSLGIYGKVSVDKLNGKQLPYTDNLVNLIVAEDLDRDLMDE
ncbi:MAG: methyltransferase domain-containing protein, partial [Phycisphaerae bacterium]|nr:methyltransferase domain-containing protein [Phycisphaerae bacterium]